MTRKLLPVLAVLFLSACGTHIARDDSPASDLTTLQANAERDLAPRVLPNGKAYCLELAATEGAQDTCAGWLEDGFYQAEQDKARGLANITLAVRRLALERLPSCRFYQVGCMLERRALQRQIDAAAAALPKARPPP